MTNKGNSIGFIYCAQDFTTLKKFSPMTIFI